ncbi:uncharacterized protein LOC119114692 [Pollicipes pollicipes]|uniref:uncharacterized protein LOC119114692 n=1 Tax=Pollicipes pollicipes TaxID=41117 RepID=UPI001884E138|nr:uncharacterized protein LOC119114692 [Pollicipes pollicipes]
MGEYSVPPLACDTEPAWVSVGVGRVVVREEARRAHGTVKCEFADVLFVTDERVEEGAVTVSETAYELHASDFVRVRCRAADGATWQNVVAGVRAGAAPSARRLDQLSPSQLPLNVLIWGFDSLSRNTYERKLPKTVAFLRKQLGAVILQGYNIVGDGTPQALIPILTGQTEPELPETRKRFSSADFVNVYPFIWKKFADDGFVTAFNEDQPHIGTFQYRLKGFMPQPTTHYMRPFYLATKPGFGRHKPHCLRDTPRHKVMTDYVEQLYAAYPHTAKFIFSFHSELSHDDVNLVGVADDDMVAFLTRMRNTGALNNTALLMMADHGHRFTAVRNTQQGKLEERLPFVAWALPAWVGQRYPEALAALRQHAQQLTTPFDLHQTLQHLRHCLLRAGSAARGCAEAAQEAARAFERYVNAEQERQTPGRCAPLRVEEILKAEVLQPQANLLRFVKSKDKDGFVPDLSSAGMTAQPMMQLRMRAAPGARTFEVTMTRKGSGEFAVRHEDVSRTDRYGDQARCVADRMDHMRKLCFCRD